MKVLGYILEFLVSPFEVLYKINFKGMDTNKHKVWYVILAIILSILLTVGLVFLSYYLKKSNIIEG